MNQHSHNSSSEQAEDAAEYQAQLALEQANVTRLYARVDELRDRKTHQLRSVRSTGAIGSVQNQSERDSFAALYEDRIAQLDGVEHRLVFGRLDRSEDVEWEQQPPGFQQDRARYIGRVGLTDQDQTRLLIDWRAPEAAAFYQATAFEPRGVARRRHLTLKGREVLGFEDDVLDPNLARASGHSHGDGALIAALTAPRTGRMGDIVATIQAEQDRIIRARLRGVNVVQGGPGTGKTAVALHRAAYLLYEQRERLGRAGVLVVGPSETFMRYIERVLPSLGETGVVMSSLATLYPGVDAAPDTNRRAAWLKGSLEMVEGLRRAVTQRQRVIAKPRRVRIEGMRVTVEPNLIKQAQASARSSRQPHNQARDVFVEHAVQGIVEMYQQVLERDGVEGVEHDPATMEKDVRRSKEVRILLNLCWMPTTARRLIDELFSRPHILDSVFPNLSQESRRALLREPGEPFTEADVPLLDEADELLGPLRAHDAREANQAEAQRERDLENARKALSNVDADLEELGVDGVVDEHMLLELNEHRATGLSAVERAQADREWTYGHAVVDEAQELTGMQWRLLMRRVPSKSFTVVGDMAQAAHPGAASSWQAALAPHVGDRFNLEELTVNYRTPRQVVEVAESMARAEGLPLSEAESVRDAIREPRVQRVAQPDHVTSAVIEIVSELSEYVRGGLVAVVAPAADISELTDQLRQAYGNRVGNGTGYTATGQRIIVISTNQAKGLEFDAVVIVEPARIMEEDHAASGVYVGMTRTTQDLILVASPGQLPASLE